MKKGIHPQFFDDAEIKDNSSGKTFRVGSTVREIHVEISSLTHPFYTGKQSIVDTEDRVKKYEERMKKLNSKKVEQKKAKKVTRAKKSVAKGASSKSNTAPASLKDLLKSM